MQLYCSTCKCHTLHTTLSAMYATQCSVCHAMTSQLMRMQAESASAGMVAPDGTAAIVVDNDTKQVTFYVPSGPHQGYYHHDKLSGNNSITAG